MVNIACFGAVVVFDMTAHWGLVSFWHQALLWVEGVRLDLHARSDLILR